MKAVERLRFIGEDGSMGYRHGQTYDVHVYQNYGVIYVEPVDGDPPRCPYSSFTAFMWNWAAS